jgi:hypothetical protein
MSDARQIQDDLSFVREAVSRRERAPRSPASIAYLWAAYVLVGYTLIDVAPKWAGWFLMIGGFAGGILSGLLGKRASRQLGEYDRAQGRREMLHWGAGILLAVVSAFALAAVIPELRGAYGAQVLVVMIGVVYFLAGVHFERHYLWLGPVVIAGGVLVGFVPHYGWTALGAVIAIGLAVPTFFPPREKNPSPADSRK